MVASPGKQPNYVRRAVLIVAGIVLLAVVLGIIAGVAGHNHGGGKTYTSWYDASSVGMVVEYQTPVNVYEVFHVFGAGAIQPQSSKPSGIGSLTCAYTFPNHVTWRIYGVSSEADSYCNNLASTQGAQSVGG